MKEILVPLIPRLLLLALLHPKAIKIYLRKMGAICL